MTKGNKAPTVLVTERPDYSEVEAALNASIPTIDTFMYVQANDGHGLADIMSIAERLLKKHNRAVKQWHIIPVGASMSEITPDLVRGGAVNLIKPVMFFTAFCELYDKNMVWNTPGEVVPA